MADFPCIVLSPIGMGDRVIMPSPAPVYLDVPNEVLANLIAIGAVECPQLSIETALSQQIYSLPTSELPTQPLEPDFVLLESQDTGESESESD